MYSEMKHIIFKNDYVIAVCKDKEVADLYVTLKVNRLKNLIKNMTSLKVIR